MSNPLRKLANFFGYNLTRIRTVSKKSYSSDLGEELEEMIEVVKNNTMLQRDVLLSLYHQALFCEKQSIEGDFVECGVWKGGAVGLMSLVNLKHGNERRNIHLFDSFQEICEPDESIDGQRAVKEAKAWSKAGGTKGKLVPLVGVYDHLGGPGTIENNKLLLVDDIRYPEQYLHFHEGWFQDTLPKDSPNINKIAILRIDADWYASTYICLDYLFEKVVKGGFVIFDDYGTYEGCQKAVDEYLSKKDNSYFLNYVTQDVRYIVKL